MAKESKTEFNMTFFDVAYSVAGRSNVEVIYKSLEQLDKSLLTIKENEVLGTMLMTYKADNMFPSWTYLTERYGIVSNCPIRNLGDLKTTLRDLMGYRAAEMMKMELSNATVQADSADELSEMIQKTAAKWRGQVNVNTIETFSSVREQYEFLKNAPIGITTGIPTIDQMTAGFQQGTIATVAAFTSHGKSTLVNNLAYLNASKGKKVGVVSLEIVALLCKYIYLSRHSYTMGRPIEYSTIIRGHMTKEEQRMMFGTEEDRESSIEGDFIKNIAPNLAIVGGDDIPSYTEKGFAQLYEMLEEKLGGLDLIIWDHVNQFRFVQLAPGLTGDHCIKWLTDLTKSYVNKKGNHPVTLFVVQTNREGYKRAARNDGRYELTALSDFNEIEKSSTYVLFTFADEQKRQSEQALVQLLKHRLGMVMLEPEMVEVQYRYSMVGRNFVDVITSMDPNREDDLNDMFFSSAAPGQDAFVNAANNKEQAAVRTAILGPNTDFDKQPSTAYNKTANGGQNSKEDFVF